MRWRLLLGAVVCLALAAGTAAANVQQIPLQGGNPQLEVVSQSLDELSFRVDVGELTAFDVTTKEGPFTRLLIPGFHSSKIEGAPELPMMNRLLAVPYGAVARVEANVISSRTIDLADYGITNPLFPAQPSMPKNADPETWPFVYDRAAYQVDKAAQELVRVVAQGRLRAMDLARLEISPVEYYPASNQIRVAETIEVRVTFDGASKAGASDLISRTYSPFFENLYAGVANSRAFQDAYPDRVADVVTMVIVTAPEFEAQLQDFIDWKTERGFHVIVGVVGSPEVGSTTTSIQAYLHGLYGSGTPELPAPSFVLFVGDVAQVPTFFEGGDATDRPYCAVDADLVPDMYYGRFSATNSSQLQAQLDKTMMYDQYTMPDPSYLGEVCMIAGADSYWAPTHANGQINYGTTYYFNEAHGMYSHTYLYPASAGSDAQIIQDVSNGVGYVNYTAHGSTTSWSDPTFTQSDINGLANVDKYCMAVGNCCLTSSYDIGECMGETWLRAPNKGAIGYIGGSNSTYWDEDYWWGVGYVATVTANPTYEGTGLGAYDGLFHDHGQAEHLWYVTNDAIIFAGNLAVMESGSSRITYYWNIYNLLGDPSLTAYLGVPTANPVTHPETVFTNAPDITIGAAQNSYVGLTQDGVLVGAGTVGASGSLTIEFLQTPLTPGVPLHVVVMAQNRQPYVTDLNVIVPATVIIDPMVIDANVTTGITVTVLESDNITPKPNVNIWAEGLDYATTPVPTDVNGVAVITVNYPYGPTLNIVGQEIGESYRLFTEQVGVNAMSMASPDLYVTTDIGLSDAFALNLPGTLHATVSEPGFTLWAFLPGGTSLSTADPNLELTPTALGQVHGIIAVSGYDLYSEDFDIIEAYGTLTGTVASGGSPLAGVTVEGYDAGMNLAFQAVTDGSGAYDVGDDILVAPYTLVVDYFGYLHYETPFFVNYGANVHDIDLTPAPSGVVTGTVTALDTGDPLAATVRVYRGDTMELYAETATDPADGSYTTPALPYFDYRITVKAWHYIPVTIDLTIEEAVVEKHFVLEPTIGDLLLIDAAAKQTTAPDKIAADGTFLAPGYELGEAKAAADMQADLEDLGYTVTPENASSSDPGTWENYDLVMVSAGSSTAVFPTAFQQALIAFAQGGGHLLIEGGEVGYAHYSGDFGTYVLHSNDWNHDQSGSVTVADPAHYVMSVPNVITGPISVAYSDYGDQDAMVPNADAVMVGSWTDYPSDASIICYDTNPAPQGGQIVYFCWNYSAMDAAARPALLQNAVTWLTTPEFGNCSVSGTATLQGETDHSGIRVEAIPNGGSTITGADGSFSLPGLFAGTYQIVASKEGFRTDSTEVSLSDGQHLTGLELMLGAPGSISGVATLKGETDHSGIRVEAQPGGVFVITGPDGAYTLDGLLAGDYIVRASKLHWTPATAAVTLHDDEDITGIDLILSPTSGSLLVIDDSAAGGEQQAKYTDKGDILLAPGYTAPDAKTAAHMAGDLEAMGYSVVMESVGTTDPAGWLGYDCLIWSCGNNTTTITDPAMLTALQSYVAAGGRLLMEGGEVGYDHYGTTFATQVLHITTWHHDGSGDVTIAVPTHPVMSVPNVLTSPMGMTYVGYGDEDALVPTADAQMIGSWTSWPTDASIIVYDDTPSPEAGQIVFFAFNYSALATSCAPNLLQNAMTWLLASENPGTASIAGTCYVSDAPDNSGVTVTAYPGGATYVTGPEGTYELADLFAGTYTVSATKPGYGAAPQVVTLGAGQQMTGVDFGLGLISELNVCDAAGTAIPDANPAGISRTLLVTETGILSDIYCSVDITHTYQGDLIVELTSPQGTTVRLHNRTGSSAEDIHAVYDLDTQPDGPGTMADFDGEDPLGEWTLFVSDNAAADVGTLDEWCLDLFIAEPVIGVAAGAIQAATVTGGVALSWPYDMDAVDGFHVYRRTADGETVRLTTTPLAGHDGRFEYVDPGYGITTGTVLYYSYGLVQGGQEVARSEEVEVTFAGSAPTRFALHPNWPNPFNPLTNIRFDLPEAGHVKLLVYDVSGRLVRTLVDENLPAAVYLKQWDGTDNSGRRAASGIYYYRLVTRKDTATGKMMLVK